MNDDRFMGEAAEPPVILRCDYCGSAIRQGCGYYVYEQKAICDACAKRFAWDEFLTLSQKRFAKPAHWI
jgi:hypothetical protein